MLSTRLLASLLALLLVSCYAAGVREMEESSNSYEKDLSAIPADLLTLIFNTKYGESRLARSLYESLGLGFTPENDLIYQKIISVLIFSPVSSADGTGIMNLSTIIRIQDLFKAAERACTSEYEFKEMTAFCFLFRAKQLMEQGLPETSNCEAIEDLRKDVLYFLNLIIQSLMGLSETDPIEIPINRPNDPWIDAEVTCFVVGADSIMEESERILTKLREEREDETLNQKELLKLSKRIMLKFYEKRAFKQAIPL